MLPDRNLTGELYSGMLQNTSKAFTRQHFGDNYRCQDGNATPHRAQIVLDSLQQGNVTKTEQPAWSPDSIPIEHILDELGSPITSMDNPSQNLNELRQALSYKWAKIPVERLRPLVASTPRRLAAILAVRGGNSRNWPGVPPWIDSLIESLQGRLKIFSSESRVTWIYFQ